MIQVKTIPLARPTLRITSRPANATATTRGRIVIQEVDHVEIQILVPVGVEKRCPKAPGRIVHSGVDGLKSAVTEVVVKHVGAVVGHVDVRRAVPVVIAHRNAHAVTRIPET